MAYNHSPRQPRPDVLTAVVDSYAAMEAAGLTREQILGEQLPLFAATASVRAGYPGDTISQQVTASRVVGPAIDYLVSTQLAKR